MVTKGIKYDSFYVVFISIFLLRTYINVAAQQLLSSTNSILLVGLVF
jgi:hypothetical protein